MPAIDHWWQTETGWPIGANCIGLGILPVRPGSCTKPVPGYDVRVLADDASELPPAQIGQYRNQATVAAGLSPTLWNNDEGYRKAYLARFPGYYLTSDAGYKDEDGYLWVMTRTDDIINVAGHRLSTGALEEAGHLTADRRVRGPGSRRQDQRGSSDGVDRAQGRRAAFRQRDRKRDGPDGARKDRRHRFFRVATVVKRLPKTRSGKILRGTIKKIADGVDYQVPPTIDDPLILDEIAGDLSVLGYPARSPGS